MEKRCVHKKMKQVKKKVKTEEVEQVMEKQTVKQHTPT